MLTAAKFQIALDYDAADDCWAWDVTISGCGSIGNGWAETKQDAVADATALMDATIGD